MVGFNPTFYAGRPKLSEVTIDSDLDMGVRTVKAAKAQLGEIDGTGIKITGTTRFGKTVISDTLILPYTVIPSDNVFFTSDISETVVCASPVTLNGSIVIGPTSRPISVRLYCDIAAGHTGSGVQLHVYKNGVLIESSEVIEALSSEVAIDLTGLSGGDVLTFTVHTDGTYAAVTFSNFRLAGDVVTDIVNTPTAETV